MKAIRDNIIIQVEDIKKTESGIILPDKDPYKNPTREGVVVSIGPQVKLDIKVGDRVLCINNYGHDIKDATNDIHYIVLEEEFILATIENE